MTTTIGAPAPAALPQRAALPADPGDAAAISAAVTRLRTTESGREVADFLAASHVEIRVVPNEVFKGRYPGAGAVYDPRTRLITVPQGAVRSPGFVTTLAHEGKHALDFKDRPHWALQSMGLLAGTAADGAKALVTLYNPVTAWLDSLTARQNEDEVNAYHVQAQVAHELGINESAWSLGQAASGEPLPLEDVRTRVATNDLYRMEPGRRLALGAGLGLATTSVAAIGAQALAGKLAPGSFLARHGWPLYAIGGAMTAAWVVADQARARRLEA
ncbi:MAG: hypothetical protein JWM86_1797 [Thermoleophilia bacterium]|nr:hypothetical protein [Thermoleophilia bacterium]